MEGLEVSWSSSLQVRLPSMKLSREIEAPGNAATMIPGSGAAPSKEVSSLLV